ncbi:alpha-L-fucosidase-like [Haliotis rubra]|uniref:alpha-L-fucosidase-like n=1 Tax=Haliotis rubra TaxID=36100 RepID=UPI001EE60AE5|nr:alpha-L-fucosidase-like [Haliotis rubra]
MISGPKMKRLLEGSLLLTFVCLCVATPTAKDKLSRYEPNWASIDSRPLPAWYDEAKLGIFVHWGIFSVPSFGSEWFWWLWQGQKVPDVVAFMKDNYRPDWTYADFARDFTAEFFDPVQWANIFNASGAQYVVLVSKHHEGFCNWPTNVSFNWNSQMLGPNRDLVGELAAAVRGNSKIRFGLYHSLFEWFHPLYLQDKANNFSTSRFVDEKTIPELIEISEKYKPEVIWSDGDWEAPSSYWKSAEYLAWLYNDSPTKDTVVTNDRWGSDATCHHGGFLTCMDRYNPGTLQPRKFENAMTIDKKSWGFRRNADLAAYLNMEEILATFAETISCGGNMLINVGPTKYGMISAIYEERFRQLGSWLSVNGEGIYSTRPWTSQNDTVTQGVWYVQKDSNVYAIVLNWPEAVLQLGAPKATAATTVSLLGYEGNFSYQDRAGGGINIEIPPIPINKMPCEWAWIFKFTGLQS